MEVDPSNPSALLTPAEYLALERDADHKSDYYKGEVFSMAGGTSPHSKIAANLIIAVGRRLDAKPCGTHTSDMKVHPLGTEFFAYPNVSVVCGEEQYFDGSEDCITNPHLLAEVLSPSTQNYDREKFFHYQQIPTLEHYLLIHQERAWIEHFTRPNDKGGWHYHSIGHPEDSVEGLKATLSLSSLSMEIPLLEIYRLVRLAPFLHPKQ